MELFNVFKEDIKMELLIAPLKHPNIEYNWIERKFSLNNENSNIISIGNIIDDGNLNIISFQDEELGFIDKNQNLVTPILLHQINLKKPIYNIILNELENEFKKISDKKIDVVVTKNIDSLIERLDDDVTFYMDVIKYIRSNKFEISGNKEDIDYLIDFVKNNSGKAVKNYPHLRLMATILGNKGI